MKRGIVECLNGMAALAATQGRMEEAARLAAMAREEFTALGAGIWPADRQDLARLLESAGVRMDGSRDALALDEALRIGRERFLRISRS